MRTKMIGWAALVAFILTVVWLILLIWEQATAGPLQNIEQVVAYLTHRSWRYTLTYLNAAAVTLAATALMALLYQYSREVTPEWALIGLVFVPVYCTLNLVAYLTQITLVPALVNHIAASADDPLSYLLLGQLFQLWPDSTVGFFNGLAYAILGIPSIIYGLVLTMGNRLMKGAGWLLVLNGLACILGIIGYLSGSALLAQGIIAGGVLYLLALIPLSAVFLRPLPEAGPSPNGLMRNKTKGS